MDKPADIDKLKKIAKELSLLILDISYAAKTCHVGSALSISDLLTVLYFSKLNLTKTNVDSLSRDRFILSKGHAAAALYSLLHKKGILTKKELDSFGQDVGGLCEHPEITTKGVEMSTGSLGHGLAFGVGIALGQKKLSQKAQVYVLISDGELGEGSVWEAAILASRLKLDNLTAILDNNNWQCFGRSEEITPPKPLIQKWHSFGWKAVQVDGHNIADIKKTFNNLPFEKEKPNIIIAKTISGKGISLIEDKLIGHYKVFNEEEYLKARGELQNQ